MIYGLVALFGAWTLADTGHPYSAIVCGVCAGLSLGMNAMERWVK